MKTVKLMAALAVGSMLMGGAYAKEGGDQYPNGAEQWYAGAVPPPGNYLLNYTGHYSGRLKDGNGNKVDGAKVNAWFNAFRFVHTSEHKILGGNWGWHAIVPVVHQSLSLGAGSQTVSGLGDITINPFILSWHSENWHWATGLDINLPTGRYKAGEPRHSIGANYYSVEPLFAVTYLNSDGWEASAKFMYNIKTTNKSFRPAPGAPRMDYKSGDEFHVDYLLGKRFGPWGVGLSGYYLKQTTNDNLDGRKISSAIGPWSDGRKGQVFAIGPSLTYTNKSGMQFIAQWQHETKVENRFGGDKFMLKLVVPL